MRSLSDTLERLKRLPGTLPRNGPESTRLAAFSSFGSNPGQLSAWIHVPETTRAGSPMVVVLHGCTQTAAGYDEASGWSRLADRHGFVVVYPEQRRSNNPNLCFNWFSPADTARGSGEALSIRQLVAAVQARHRTDPRRVFVTGLSAGGAMAATMLATYPDVFAGGAVIAGLPYGIAASVPDAFDRMRGHGGPSGDALADLVRAASGHSGSWPTLSVWHGTSDATVDPSNAEALVTQWRALQGLYAAPSESHEVEGHARLVWRDSGGREVIEQYRIAGLGHGTPLNHRGSAHGETAAPFMLDAGISSTHHIARFWGIVSSDSDEQRSRVRVQSANSIAQRGLPVQTPPHSPIRKTIEDALRGAGLIR